MRFFLFLRQSILIVTNEQRKRVLNCVEKSSFPTDRHERQDAAPFSLFVVKITETLDFFIDVFLEFSKPKATEEEREEVKNDNNENDEDDDENNNNE